MSAVLALTVLAGCRPAERVDDTAPEPATGSETSSGYANPQLLTATDDLATRLGDKDLRILDVRPPEEYQAGHIEGALNLPIGKTNSATGPVEGMLAPKGDLEKLLGDLGVANDSKVVVYDNQITPMAGRLFWILEYLGHEHASLLDGGLAKWRNEGRGVTKDTPTRAKATYRATPVPERLATKEEVRALIGKQDAVLLDTRPLPEYVAGHLPDAVRMDWTELLTADDPPVIKSGPELAKLFADAGVTKDVDLVLY